MAFNKREYNRKWLLEHPDYQKKAKERYDRKNPGRSKELIKKWRENNPNYLREWTAKNPGYFAKKGMEFVKADLVRWAKMRTKYLDGKRNFVIDLKKNGVCEECGFKDFRALEWAHKRGTIATKKAWVNLSWPNLLAEIKKCRMLCANCHRIYDWKERQKHDKAKRGAAWGKLCQARKDARKEKNK